MDELQECAAWMAASDKRRDAIVQSVLAHLPRFEFAYARNYGPADNPFYIVSLRDTGTGIVFNLIPGGTFLMGLSEGEREILQSWMTPDVLNSDEISQVELLLDPEKGYGSAQSVQMKPFLIARFPVLAAQCEAVLGSVSDDGCFLFDPPDVAFIWSPNTTEAFMASHWGYRLPAEAQWEYACRGGRQNLFPWGNSIPRAAYWTSHHTDDLKDLPTVNRFGLASLGGFPEVCANQNERFNWNLMEGEEPYRMVRGGASLCYPWQGCGEWMGMLCGERYTGVFDTYAIRPVLSLPSE